MRQFIRIRNSVSVRVVGQHGQRAVGESHDVVGVTGARGDNRVGADSAGRGGRRAQRGRRVEAGGGVAIHESGDGGGEGWIGLAENPRLVVGRHQQVRRAHADGRGASHGVVVHGVGGGERGAEGSRSGGKDCAGGRRIAEAARRRGRGVELGCGQRDAVAERGRGGPVDDGISRNIHQVHQRRGGCADAALAVGDHRPNGSRHGQGDLGSV